MKAPGRPSPRAMRAATRASSPIVLGRIVYSRRIAPQQYYRHLPHCQFRRYHATRSARSSQNPDRLPVLRKRGGACTRQHVVIIHWRRRASWMNLASPLARPLGTRHRPQRRMSLVWESYCATRSRSSLHTEAPIEPLRERPDQSEARQASVGVLQIEAEPLVLHKELV